jgi:hypothetical protein
MKTMIGAVIAVLMLAACGGPETACAYPEAKPVCYGEGQYMRCSYPLVLTHPGCP